MSVILQDVCDDILCNIFSYLDQTSRIQLTRTCRRIYEYGLSFGYLKILQFSHELSYLQSMNALHLHSRTIEEIIVTKVPDPDIWIEKFAKVMIFNDCNITVLNPPFITKTEEIYIHEKRKSPKSIKRCKVIREKFPYLRKLVFVK